MKFETKVFYKPYNVLLIFLIFFCLFGFASDINSSINTKDDTSGNSSNNYSNDGQINYSPHSSVLLSNVTPNILCNPTCDGPW